MPLRRPLASVILLFTAVLALICSGKPQEDGRTATFYGGQHRVRLTPDDRYLQVSLRFKTLLDSGLLSVVRYEDNSGYFAFGVAGGQLQATVKHYRQSQTLVVGQISSDWNNLTIQLQDSTLTVALGNSNVSSSLSLSVSLKDIYFGGAHNFFAPIFTDLNFTDFFVGCIDLVSVNSKLRQEILFAAEYGIELGCCPNPRPVSWCFDSASSNLTIRAALIHQRFSTGLEISFRIRIQTSRDGIVYRSRTDSHDIVIGVDSGGVHLNLTANGTSGLRCPRMSDGTAWHAVHLGISTSGLHCQVDEAERSTALIDLPSLPRNLEGESGSFEGCIEKFQFNGIDVTPAEIPPNGPEFSAPCPPVEPETEPPPSPAATTTTTPVAVTTPSPQPECSFSDDVQWEDLRVHATPFTLAEGGTIAITSGRTAPASSGDIKVSVPESVIESQAFESALNFYVTQKPRNGYFAEAENLRRIMSFSYQEVKDGVVVYHHDGAESKTDTALLEARVQCGDAILYSVQTRLNFSILLTNDLPEVERMRELSMAVGTRRVITDEVITVTDEETVNLQNIYFSVIGIDPCTTPCGGEAAGQIERLEDEPGKPHSFFTQEDINSGVVLFQHFASSGTTPVKIFLQVSDDSSNVIQVEIRVNLYEGHVTLTTNECLYVVEGTALLLQPRHLGATTDFEDQDPDLTYDVLQLPRHGRLERAEFPQNESLLQQWVPISEIPKREDSFTQADIDSNRVRYVHDNSSQPVAANDSFRFRLRSSNLTGPEVDFCIQVVSLSALDKPSISAEVGTIRVIERGEITINESLLNISLSPPILINWLEEEVGIEQLGVTFIITPGLGPSYGELRVRGSQLVNDSFTLSDIRNGALTYTHSESEQHLDTFTFYVEARKSLEVPIRPPDPTPDTKATVVVTPVNNHVPEILDQSERISPPEGGWVAVTPRMLEVVDADRPGDNLTIAVRSNQLEEPNGYFAFSTPDMMVTKATNFSMEDVYQGRVVFMHELGKDLSHSLSIKVEDGEHTVKGSVQIEATPLSIIATPVLLPNQACVAQLDATLRPLTVTLDRSIVSLEIDDAHGNDINRFHDIVVRVVSPPTYGTLLRTIDESTMAVGLFDALDLEHGRIEYSFANYLQLTQSDSFQLEFTLGFSSSGPVPFTVCISPIPIPILSITQGIMLPSGGMHVVNASHLLYFSSRGEPGSSLSYELLVPPKRGLLFNQSEDDSNRALSSFTQEDVTNDHIAYHHTETPSAELSDFFTYRVCTAFLCTRETSFSISLYASSLIIINTGFSVTEGEKHTISDSELNAIAPPGYYVTFHVTSRGKPKRGQLNREQSGVETVENTPIFNPRDVRSGLVKYLHNGLENSLRDSFEFTATAEVDSSDSNEPLLDLADKTFSGVVNITIIPVNDHTPSVFTNKGSVEGVVHVVQGSTIQINNSLLTFHDSDSDAVDDDLQYSLIFPLLPFGTLYLENNPGVRVRSWTEGDIRNGRLFYKAPAVTQPDLFHFSVSDGVHTSFYNTFHITVTSILFKFVAPIAFELQEGSSLVISQNYLQYAAANDDTLEDSDFVYLVTRLPSHGRLLFSGRDANTFTQEDLGSSNLLYNHDDSNTESDSFEFIISVPSRGASAFKRFDIKVNPVDDDPPEVSVQDPLFVVELMHLPLNLDVLRISDLDSKTNREISQVEVRVTRPPVCGFIETSNFGGPYGQTLLFSQYDLSRDQVRYSHTMRGHWNDSFIFTVTDGSNNVQEMAFQVNITILPQKITLRVSNITVLEGDEFVLESEYFAIDHPYLCCSPGVVIIDVPPSRGTLMNKNAGNHSVSQFTTKDLANGSIVYQHGGDEHDVDQFVFHYKNTEPVDFARMSDPVTFPIQITLVNDELPTITEKQTLLVWYKETVVLSILNAVDKDNSPEELTYSVSVSSGRVAYSNATSRPIHSFTQASVNAKQVVFVHSSGNGVMNYTVSDGKNTVEGLIVIEAEPLRLHQVAKSPLTVDMGGRSVITEAHLSFTTNDNRSAEPREILYEVADVQYGRIVVDSTETNRFYQRDVTAGRVAYVHTDLDIWEPSAILMLHVSTPLAPNLSILFLVNVIHPSSSYSDLAANEPVRIEEGGTVCLDETVLDARNLRYSTWKDYMSNYNLNDVSTVFKLDQPAHGIVEVNTSETLCFTQVQIASGLVCYRHNGSMETQSDTLDFSLQVLADGSILDTFHSAINISVTLINDEKPQLRRYRLSKTVVENFPIRIEPSDLQVLDADNPPEEIVYSIVETPQNGRFEISQRSLVAGDNFTQADIDKGMLMFNPTGLGPSQFDFTYTDGSYTSDSVQLPIVVEEHVLVVVKNEVVTFRQNLPRAVITQEFLDTSTNGYRNDTYFIVVVPPSNGRIGNSEHTFMNFTQIAVDEKQVFYIPTNSDAHNDSFEVKAVNRQQRQNVAIPVRVLIWGQVKENIVLDLSSNASLRLPADILDLSDLQREIRTPPTIEVLHPPRHGYLEKIFNGYTFPRKDPYSFSYDELEKGWIYYTWNFSESTQEPAPTVTDSFTVVVIGSETVRPGEATVTVIVYPPRIPVTTPPTAATDETQESESTPTTAQPSPDTSTTDGGFPMYALVPIIGIFVILIIMVAVVVVFCITQQKRLRRKWRQSKASSTTYPYPWSAQPGTAAPASHANYSFGRATAPSEEDNNSDILSMGYSEVPPITRHSPTHSHPLYPNLPMSRSRIGRIRSNVSISVSNRIASDVSLEDSSRHHPSMLHRHPPAHLVAPLPIRPPLVRRNSRDGEESGYQSAQHRSTDTSACSVTRNHDRMNVVTPYSETDTLASADDDSTSKSSMPPPAPVTTVLTAKGTRSQHWPLQEETADTDTGDVLKLFRSTNPVLKKQEYWV